MTTPGTIRHEATVSIRQPFILQHPLGPRLIRTRNDQSRSVRRRAMCILLAAAIVLAVSACLVPAGDGSGTHTQLGLPPCSMIMGLPCPTCGMTTAFAHSVRGQWLAAINAQPLGALLAGSVIMAALMSIWELVTGRGYRINWYRVPTRWVIASIVVLVFGAWIYKIVVTRAQMG